MADKLKIKLIIKSLGDEYLSMVRNPKYGYGKNLNPCIDCRILMLKKSKEIMEELGASFVITGEVLGQRPKSQHRKALKTIEMESDLEGLILRPLSAKLLEPTIPEEKGWVDREKLLDFCGRTRKPQIKLAAIFGIKDYPCPAGGCLLTDPKFAKRMRDLVEHTPEFTINDVELLKIGKHFRFSKDTQIVVGRDKEENEKLFKLGKNGDFFLEIRDYPSPITLLRGKNEKALEIAARITARYSDAREEKQIIVFLWKKDSSEREEIVISPLEQGEIEKYRI